MTPINNIFDRAFTIACVAAEASDQDDVCQQAIIGSILNRVASGRFEPTMAGVVAQRYQMSEFLPDKADNANLERVLNAPDSAMVARATSNYDAMMTDPALDPSEAATHFYAEPAHPNWAVAPARETVVHGKVHFWTNVA
jgi:spore germination cell wall hydrolase CwlJ-like protein